MDDEILPYLDPVLLGADLSSVMFVRDYQILSFEGSTTKGLSMTISYYVSPVVIAKNRIITEGERDYRNALCDLINAVVTQIEFADNYFVLHFSETRLACSLNPLDRITAEAFEITGPNHLWYVYR